MYTWHTLLHYPHGANAGCDLAGVAPVATSALWTSNGKQERQERLNVKLSCLSEHVRR